MKNKKGFLLGEQTVSIVIAVLAIIVLIGLGAKLFGIFIGENDLVKAEAHLEPIMAKIKFLEFQGGGSEKHELLGPENWILTGWPSLGYTTAATHSPRGDLGRKEHPYNGKLPNECTKNDYKKCLCLCPRGLVISNNFLSSCNEQSVCSEINTKDIIVAPSRNGEKKFNAFIEISSFGGVGKSLQIKLENNILIIEGK